MDKHVQVAIIGGGPAGLAAALAAHKAGATSILVLERDSFPGGILQQCIHNGFGLHYFGQELTGPEYAQRFIDEVEKIEDIEILLDTMVMEVNPDRSIVAVSSKYGLVTVKADAVVLAMGCRERTRGALNIPGTRPAGVYTAGCAQRLVNMEGMMPGKKVVILGSGDIGLIMARRMVWEGAKVEMVCELMPYSSGLNRNIVQCLEDNDIPLYFNTTVINIHGKERVEGVTIAEVDPATRLPKMETARFVECDTLMLSVGLIPENELTLGAGVEMDRITSGAVVDAARQTEVEGIFACGNVLQVHDLVDYVSEEAAIAGRAAARYVMGSHTPTLPEPIRIEAGEGIRYCLPSEMTREEAVDLYLRVSGPMQGAVITVWDGDRILRRYPRVCVAPGEMERITLKMKDISERQGNTLRVTLEKRKGEKG